MNDAGARKLLTYWNAEELDATDGALLLSITIWLEDIASAAWYASRSAPAALAADIDRESIPTGKGESTGGLARPDLLRLFDAEGGTFGAARSILYLRYSAV